jgi:hypothetical protein
VSLIIESLLMVVAVVDMVVSVDIVIVVSVTVAPDVSGLLLEQAVASVTIDRMKNADFNMVVVVLGGFIPVNTLNQKR